MNIINNLPSVYDGLMETLEDKLDSALDPLTISVLRDKISEKYERIKRRHGLRDYDSDSEDEDEKALLTKIFKGQVPQVWEVWSQSYSMQE